MKKLIILLAVLFALISCSESPIIDDYDFCQDIPELKIENDIEFPIKFGILLFYNGKTINHKTKSKKLYSIV